MILLLGAAMAGQVEIVVEQTINAPASAVMATLGDFGTWKEWSAWNQVVFPECVWTYEGEAGTVGHAVSWEGPKCKTGSMAATAISDSSFAYDLFFGKSDANWPSTLTVAEADGVSTVAWTMTGELGFFMSLFSGAMEKAITLDYTVGLAGLKARVETEQVEAAAAAAVEAATEAVDDAVEEADEAVEGAVDEAAAPVEEAADSE